MNLQQRMRDIIENPHLISFYAKSNCRQCHGRGIITRNLPDGTGDWHERKDMCECVRKAVRKETKELEADNG